MFHNATLPTSSLAASLPQLLSSLTPTTPLGVLLSLGLLLAVAYATYRRALPKPLPGIPYNPGAARSILGDLPEIYAASQTRDMRSWFATLIARNASPVVQILSAASGFSSSSSSGNNKTVVVSDFATTQDILLRRSREFDRPRDILALLRGVTPHHHIAMATADAQFRRNREMVRDLMTPAVLHGVNAPEIWRGAGRFVELWKAKARVAGGRPFEAAEDVSLMTFEIIKNVAVGREEEGTLMETYLEQIDAKYGMDSVKYAGAQRDAPFVFPLPPHDDTLEALYHLGKALTPEVPLPPRLHHAINNRRPHMRKAFATKESMLKRHFAVAVKRMEAGEPLESALDYMIKRELGSAKKAERAPVLDSPNMLDELFGYLGAGHDTTATTFSWGMKHLAKHPEAQKKARDNLRAVFKEAYAEGRPPSVTEILKNQVPYLDAVIEEILRLSAPVGDTARVATVDTVILGHHIPKGTTVVLVTSGPGLTKPSIQLPPAGGRDKTPSSVTKRLNWDGMSPEQFLPERWLATDEKGNVVYDAQAGPFLSFSLGIRGCFGIRLAYLTLRMLFTMLIWNFELERVPEELDSWKSVQILTSKPVQCYVRLTEIA